MLRIQGQNIRQLLVVLLSVTMIVGSIYVMFFQLTAPDIMYRFLVSGLLVSVLGFRETDSLMGYEKAQCPLISVR